MPDRAGTVDGMPLDALGRERPGAPGPRDRHPKWLYEAAAPALLAVLTLLFAAGVIRDFSGPLLGPGDVNIWGYQGYYFSRNIHFWPLPHLDLVNDQLLYPYRMDNVFQTWGFEREYFWAALDALFGPGPWLQIYYALSVLITAVGSYLILSRQHSRTVAAAVGLAVTFGNYYAIASYPYHQTLSCLHWVILNLFTDYLLLRRLWERRPLSARLLLFKGLLLVLIFGNGLAYIDGLALTSFLFCCATAAAILAGRKELGPVPLRRAWSSLVDSARTHPGQCLALSLLTAAAFVLLVPLSLQILLHVRRFDFSHVPAGTYWVTPLRLLLPILPHFNPETYGRLFNDMPDKIFCGTPGVSFVLLGLMGLIFGRRLFPVSLPFLALLLLCVFFIPPWHTALAVFPWFGLIRVGGRFTPIYPVLCCILGLTLPPGSLKRLPARALVLLLGCLFLAEGGIAYQILLRHQPPPFFPDRSFDRFMASVKGAPGEAVFQWPFCVAGGGGDANWIFYYDRLYGTFALQQFHHKKELGVYFARLHPSQVAPLWRAGWHRMFTPDSPNIERAARQRADFDLEEWSFLTSFLAANDFCGIILYTDLLQPETVRGFHDRFGPSSVTTTLPGAGRAEFIPKALFRGALQRPIEGSAVKLGPALLAPLQKIDLSSPASDPYLLEGWGRLSPEGRWTMGEKASVAFRIESGAPALKLRFEAHTYQAQRMEILLNGHPLETLRHNPDAFAVYETDLPSALLSEDNRIDLVFPDAHSPLDAGESQDPRLLGAWVRWMELEPQESNISKVQ